MRIPWKLPLAVLLTGIGTWLLLHWYAQKPEGFAASDRELYRASLRLAGGPPAAMPKPKAIPARRRVRVALGNLGLPNEEDNGRVCDLLVAKLSRAPGIQMVERQALGAILKELNLSLSGLVRAGDAVRAGKLLRADWFLLGTPMHANSADSLVVRVVDARTGIFRDVAVVAADKGPQTAADELAAFIQRCRSDAVEAKAPIYLAVGALDDLSLNNRLAELPAQLHSHLLASYRHSQVTLLEREHVETLLQELRLDLAGLTESGGTNGAVMQAAVWLVEGDYQSYDNPTPQVEVALRLSRMFGLSRNLAPIRRPVGEPLFSAIKSAIDKTINQPQPFPIVTRVTEAGAQFRRGRELAGFSGWNWGGGYRELTAQEARAEKRKFAEAIRAFETVLLLEPTNRAAKVYLAACCCQDVVGRTEEGRALFREVLDESVQDQWNATAARELLNSFSWTAPAERFRWFSAASAATSNTNVQAFYRAQAAKAQQDWSLQQGAKTQPEAIAEKTLRDGIRSEQSALEGKSGTQNIGMPEYVHFFHPDKLKGARKLAEILPRLMSEFPAMAPHLSAQALSYQVETNNPVLPEFTRQLEACRAHPERVLALWNFWSRARYDAYDWCMTHGNIELAAQILEGVKQAARYTNSVTYDDQDNIALAYTYKEAGRWQPALDIFESYSNLPVEMSRGSGPWGRAFLPLLTSKEAAFCREKLGLPARADPREFDFETDCVPQLELSAFAADPSGLWLAVGAQLIHLDFDLQTDFVQSLPMDVAAGVNCLLIGSSNLWIGTDGGGLLEFNKGSRNFVHYGEKDGLMSDVVHTLCLADDTLWIGYGLKGRNSSRMAVGGLGMLDLPQRHFRSFTPSLAQGVDAFGGKPFADPANVPTRHPVGAVAVGSQGDVWFAAPKLHRFRQQDNVWETFPGFDYCSALAVNQRQLVAAKFWNWLGTPQHGVSGINILNFADGSWTKLGDFGVLPSGAITALRLEGEDLWVGGMGYVAKINLRQGDLRRYAYVQAQGVEQLQIAGGFVWTQYNRHLHRARLPL